MNEVPLMADGPPEGTVVAPFRPKKHSLGLEQANGGDRKRGGRMSEEEGEEGTMNGCV